MAVSRHLEFLEIESGTIRSADPENPTLEPNIKVTSCLCVVYSRSYASLSI